MSRRHPTGPTTTTSRAREIAQSGSRRRRRERERAALGRLTSELDAVAQEFIVDVRLTGLRKDHGRAPGGRRARPPTPLAELIRRHLDPLSARLRGSAIDALARRLGERTPAEALTAIPGLCAALRREHAAISRRHAALEAEVAAAATPEDREAALAAAIVRETPPGRRRRRDLRALRRWLDVEAIGERVARRLDDLEVEIELAVRLAAAILLEEGTDEATDEGGAGEAAEVGEAARPRSPSGFHPVEVDDMHAAALRAAEEAVAAGSLEAGEAGGAGEIGRLGGTGRLGGAEPGEAAAASLAEIDPGELLAEIDPGEPLPGDGDAAAPLFAARAIDDLFAEEAGAPIAGPAGAPEVPVVPSSAAPAPPVVPPGAASAPGSASPVVPPSCASPPTPGVPVIPPLRESSRPRPAPVIPPLRESSRPAPAPVIREPSRPAPAPVIPPLRESSRPRPAPVIPPLRPSSRPSRAALVAPLRAPEVEAAAADSAIDLAVGDLGVDPCERSAIERSAVDLLVDAADPGSSGVDLVVSTSDPGLSGVDLVVSTSDPGLGEREADAPRPLRRARSALYPAAQPIAAADGPRPVTRVAREPSQPLAVAEPDAPFAFRRASTARSAAASLAPVAAGDDTAARIRTSAITQAIGAAEPASAAAPQAHAGPLGAAVDAALVTPPSPPAPPAGARLRSPSALFEAALPRPPEGARRRGTAHPESPGDALVRCFLAQLLWLPRFTLRVACLEALAALADATRPSIAELDVITLAATVRGRLDDPSEHPWVIGAAARLLLKIAPRAALPAIAGRLGHHAPGRRDFLARRLFVDVIADFATRPARGRGGDARLQAAEVLIQAAAANDPSELVRVGLVEAAAALARVDTRGVELLERAGDPTREASPRVRAHAVRAAASLSGGAGARLLAAWLPAEADELVLRVACESTSALAARLVVDGEGPGLKDMTYEPVLKIMSQGQVAKDMSLESASVDAAPPRGVDRREVDDAVDRLAAALARLAAQTDRPAVVHEAAAAALEALDRLCDPTRRAWTAAIAAALAATPPGGVARVDLGRGDLPPVGDERWLARILADLARDGWGLDASITAGRLSIRRGDRFRPRLWRLLHELRNPGAGKRQAHTHVRGRVLRGTIRAHSGRLHEVTATTVPGERVQIEREGGWGRHLPLVDDLLGLPLRGDRALRIASSFGVTEVRWAHHDVRRRALARARITLRYAWLSELRRHALAADEPEARGRYAAALRSHLGILLDFRAYPLPRRAPQRLAAGVVGLPPAIPGPPRPIPEQLLALFAPAPPPMVKAPARAVPRAAAAASAVVFAPELIDHLGPHLTYFLSLVGNNQRALVHFLAGLAAVFFVLAHLRRRTIARDRAAIPLVIGGWGTRGKSGTERLKAALFHGLGFRVFAKTTGCEAMFIHAAPRAPALEIYTFRPYGKATIWEQRTLLSLASRMGSDVFLWECMALSPAYVEIMQHQWMRDDLATITNCYPDHEDIQGPAGYDVAEAIAGFVPSEGTAITSEVNFAPILREAARQRRTRLAELDPFAGDLVPADLLALFPYEEHPRNVALVARLAVQLGVDPHLAISTMAEHVIPDLGVLKRFGPARVRGRVLSFINGCSANERTGFLSNWKRTGCESLSLARSPGDYIVTVVNNRDDRVARSQVFAQVLVEDVAVDRHLLIGTNLSGLLGYVREALAAFLAGAVVAGPEDLAKGSAGLERAEARLGRLLARLRLVAPAPAPLFAQLQIFAAALGLDLVDARDAVEARCAAFVADDPRASVRLSEVLAEARAALGGYLSGLLAEAPRFADEPADLPELVGPPALKEVCEHFLRQLARAAIGARLSARLRAAFDAGDGEAAIVRFHGTLRAAYTELFMELVDVVEDAHATGDQVVLRCAKAAPPGVRVTLMGTQNIKGTGLDFVYRWIALDAAQQALSRLRSPEAAIRRDALGALAYPHDAGLMDAGLVAATLGKRTAHPSEEEMQARALSVAQETHKARMEALGRSAGERSRWDGVLGWLEGWVDFLDGARRFHVARRVMEDLVDGRISRARAAMEMRKLDARAKGGWLAKAVRG